MNHVPEVNSIWPEEPHEGLCVSPQKEELVENGAKTPRVRVCIYEYMNDV